MAEVFKAKSYGVEGFEKIIAIKRILPTMGEDRDFIKMFIDEAKIAGQLAHANICQIFELGRIDGSHFIAMEYIWGKDLLQIQNRLRKLKQQMPVPLACFCIGKVLEGLDYAHRKRDPLGRPLEIVHRDCSPQNVLVSYEGEVKVIDFGIAKATSRNSRTMAGVLKGKFGYMSPEQVRGLPLDRRSDIFALGTMLYECLTGERLFQGETDFSTLEKVRNVDIQPPRSINPNIPETVEAVILKALAKDVDERYQWCGEMLADLQQYLMSQDVVFTAKSLSGWLKDVFQAEIERERQQLEQYKRVGRDGLIAGVPAAEAKLDVVEHLGEAGMPEGDATTLGGPNFDDIEVAAGAAPDVGPAPGSPAAVGERDRDDDDPGDFGEEAPTEIFGEISGTPVAEAVAQLAAARAPTQGQPTNKPPKPPPGRPTTQRPAEGMAGMPPAGSLSQPMAAQPGIPMQPPMRQPSGSAPPMQDAYVPAQASPVAGYPAPMPYDGYQPGYMTPPGQMGAPSSGQMVAAGTPGSMPVGQPHQHGGMAPPGQTQSRTVLGVAAPPGMGNYGGGGMPGGYRPTGPQMQQGPQGYAQGYPMQPGMNPYGQQPYPGQPGYGPQMGSPMAPVDPGIVPSEGKKSTLVRDIGIGVAIAALVLVGFLVVKMFILDKDDGGNTAATTSTIATIKLGLPAGTTADMFIDETKVATVSDKQEVPVTAGKRHVKLLGTSGAKCEETVQLEGGKTTLLACSMGVPAAGSAAGSATAPAAGSAGPAAGSAAAGSAAGSDAKPATADATKAGVAATDTKATDSKTVTETKPTDDKTKATDKPKAKPADKPHVTETKPAEVKASDTKATADKPADKTNPTAIPPAGDPTKGYLQVFSKPTAKISVDGTDTGMSTPISGHTLSLAPGKHKVTFVIGDDRFTYPVTIKPGQTESMTKDLQ